MKNEKRHFILGFATCLLLFALITSVFAEPITKTIEAVYEGIKINIDGKEVTPKDPQGNAIEPFSHDGTVYLPVQSMGELFGKAVTYDTDTKTMFLKPKQETPATETKIFEGQLLKKDQADMYDFNLPYSARITIEFEHEFIDNGGDYWTIQFISKNGVERRMQAKGNITNTKLTYPMYLPADDYTVKVSIGAGGGYSNKPYTVKITYEKNIGQYEYEPNGTMENATAIEKNKAIKGNIPYDYDVDYYKFSITSKKDILLKFTHDFLDQSSDFWKIELISQDKVLYSFKSRGNVMEKISDKITLTESGDYYIRVSQHVHFRQVDYSIAILE